MRLYLSSLKNLAYSTNDLGPQIAAKALPLLRHYITSWQEDNARKSEEEQQSTSLYSFRQHGEEPESDEQLIERLTKENFPSYHSVCILSLIDICVSKKV